MVKQHFQIGSIFRINFSCVDLFFLWVIMRNGETWIIIKENEFQICLQCLALKQMKEGHFFIIEFPNTTSSLKRLKNYLKKHNQTCPKNLNNFVP